MNPPPPQPTQPQSTQSPRSSHDAAVVHPALQHSPSPPPMRRSYSGSKQVQSSQKTSPTSQRTRRASAGNSAASASSQQRTPVATAGDQPLGKEDVKQMAKRFATRLQYAAFKVERGWAKYSLPEVENLYWKASRSGPIPSSQHVSASQKRSRTAAWVDPQRTAPSADLRDTTASSFWQSVNSKSNKRKASGEHESTGDDDGDVFGSTSMAAAVRPSAAKRSSPGSSSQQRLYSVTIGANGLPTPPPSAGTDPSSSSKGAPKVHPAALRVSPTRTIQMLRGQSGATSATPSAGLTSSGGRGGGSSSSNNITSNNVGASYADFWNKLGSSSDVSPFPRRPSTTATSLAPASQGDGHGVKRPRESDFDLRGAAPGPPGSSSRRPSQAGGAPPAAWPAAHTPGSSAVRS